MLEHAKQRTTALRDKMSELNITHAVFTEESSIAYLAGFWGYLGIEFGRPTMLVIHVDQDPVIITPLMESEMVAAMTWVKDLRTWEDFGPNSWGAALQNALASSRLLAELS